MLADGLRVAEVVMPRDERTEESLLGAAAYLAKVQRLNVLQRGANRRRVEFGGRWRAALDDVIRRSTAHGRQFDQARSVELEHEASTNHVAQLAVSLAPVPRLARELGEPPPARLGVLHDEIAQEGHVGRGDRPAAIAQLHFRFHRGARIA